jgi:hypothetical protein
MQTCIVIYLFYGASFNSLEFKIELIDIEAAFLEGEMDKPTYIKWPR